MNSVKRFFSCLTVLAICLATNLGAEAKAPSLRFLDKSISNQDASFYLYDGKVLLQSATNENNTKIAGHYSHSSHSSHSSHRSHYSSRY